MPEKIAPCYICRRYFKEETMRIADIFVKEIGPGGSMLDHIERRVCKYCWAKIEADEGAK